MLLGISTRCVVLAVLNLSCISAYAMDNQMQSVPNNSLMTCIVRAAGLGNTKNVAQRPLWQRDTFAHMPTGVHKKMRTAIDSIRRTFSRHTPVDVPVKTGKANFLLGGMAHIKDAILPSMAMCLGAAEYMQSSFFVHEYLAAKALTADDLKQALGFNQLKTHYALILKKPAVIERRALKDYALRLQLLASVLYQQDKVFAAYASLDNVIRANRAWLGYCEKYYSDLLGYEVHLSDVHGNVAMAISLSTERSYIIALKYRDLFCCDSLQELRARMPEIRAAKFFLSNYSNEHDVCCLGDLLDHKIMSVQIQDAIDTAMAAVQVESDCFSRLYPERMTDAHDMHVRTIIAKVFAEGGADRCPAPMTTGQESRRICLALYTRCRSEFQRWYATAVKELQNLFDAGIVQEEVCYKKGMNQLLPGVVRNGVSSVHLAAYEARVEHDDWASEGDSAETSNAAKNKHKKRVNFAQCKQEVHEVSSRAVEDDGAIEDLEKPVELSVAITSPVAQEAPLIIVVPAELHGDQVSSWELFDVRHKNKERMPQFPLRYAANVMRWQADSDGALHEQGYYDPQSVKYSAAYAFARYRGERYANDNQMRTAMGIYHAFPTMVDQYIRQYGRVERKQVRIGHGADAREEERLVVTMVGKVQLQDGREIRGLYCYIIDPATGICYHRMFEPVTKNPLAPDFYDIYFIA